MFNELLILDDHVPLTVADQRVWHEGLAPLAPAENFHKEAKVHKEATSVLVSPIELKHSFSLDPF